MARDSSARNQLGRISSIGAVFSALAFAFVSSPARAEQSGLGSAGARGARWQQGTVTVNVEASVDQLGEAAFEAVVLATSAWQNAPGILPTLVVQRGPDDPIGYRRSGANKNTVRFSPDGDPLANGALAITVITFDAHAKQILDADIILNGEHAFDFFDHDARGEGMSTYDLQNVLTHELGHLLGLGEELSDEAATMYAFSQPGETGKRDLEIVDKDSIASLYDEELDPMAQHGCGGASIAGYHDEAWMWAALGLGALGLCMRRRSSRRAALSAAALGALLFGMTVPSSTPFDARVAALGVPATDSSLAMVVTGVEAAFEDGLIVSKLSLRPEGSGPEAETLEVKTLGGQVGELVQVVGHVMPPRVGDSLRIKVRSGIKGPAIWVAPIQAQSD